MQQETKKHTIDYEAYLSQDCDIYKLIEHDLDKLCLYFWKWDLNSLRTLKLVVLLVPDRCETELVGTAVCFGAIAERQRLYDTSHASQ